MDQLEYELISYREFHIVRQMVLFKPNFIWIGIKRRWTSVSLSSKNGKVDQKGKGKSDLISFYCLMTRSRVKALTKSLSILIQETQEEEDEENQEDSTLVQHFHFGQEGVISFLLCFLFRLKLIVLLPF